MRSLRSVATITVISLVSATLLLVAQPGSAAPTVQPSGPNVAPPVPGRPSDVGAAVSSFPQRAPRSSHPIRAGDVQRTRALPPGYSLVDPVVSNTNVNLKNTDTWPDGEPSLAVNCCTIVITTFAGNWSNGSAPLYRSRDDGATWSKVNSIPRPTGRIVNGSCPCDQVVDYGRNGTLVGTFLDQISDSENAIYTGSTTNSGSASSWIPS